MSDILKDSRFSKYLNDPRYRQIPKHERKVTIDKRFQSMFKDDKFKVKYTVDKRGRPVNETSTENLRKYYNLESDDSSDSEDDNDVQKNELYKDNAVDIELSHSGQYVRRPPSDNEDNKQDPSFNKNDKLILGKLDVKIKKKLLDLDVDYARGEGILLTDSSSDEETSGTEEESDLEHEWGELDADADTTEESTKRIAVCNMDWDNIKAADIMVLLNSFLPPRRIIHKVTIYPSEYGLKRMQEEEVCGPIELTNQKHENECLSDENDNEEGSNYHMEKLRRYQLNRLKYYYAVIECDSIATADKLYSECDGLEYESSATKLDLRFIPDDVTFDQEPKECCTKLPDMSKYKPRLFTTTALQQVKVDLTWDATNPNRTDAIKNALDGKIDDLELKEYLASSSDEESDGGEKCNKEDDIDNEDDDPIKKYKNLLKDIEDKADKKQNKDMEMEVTWGLGVKDKAEELVKKKIKGDEKDLTPFEKLLEKRKDKKKQKKLDRLEKIAKNNENSEDSEENSDEIPSDIDMTDPYFAEEFNKSEFKKEKRKQNYKENDVDQEDEKRKVELELLLDEDNDGKAHFSLKKIQESENQSKKSRKKKKLKEKMLMKSQSVPDFEINLDDDRFSAIYNSHLFNIDPTDPNFKKTKNMEKIINEKLKRRPTEPTIDIQTEPKKRKDAELSVLIKNIKRKTRS